MLFDLREKINELDVPQSVIDQAYQNIEQQLLLLKTLAKDLLNVQAAA